MTATIVRAQILHTPRDPFRDGAGALEAFSDGGLAYDGDERILATATRTLPEEARLADAAYAAEVARAFVRGLARNGTTAALVSARTSPARRTRCSPRPSARPCGSRAGWSSRIGTCSPRCTSRRRTRTRTAAR